jgi:integrase
MKTRRPRYQQGSIKRVARADGFAWEVRFSETVNGKRRQPCETFDGDQYPTESSVRIAIELTVSQINAGTAGERADATFGTITAIYRKDHLPELEHSTQEMNSYLLRNYVEAKFGRTPLREVKPLAVHKWINGLKLAPSTKASIRSVMSVCFSLAALHEFIPPMAANPMTLIKLKGISKRKKKIPEIPIESFQKLIKSLTEPLNVMVLVDGCLGLRISELVALKWEDIDFGKKTIAIQRKFTRGKLGKTKSEASESELPLAEAVLAVLVAWKPKTSGSEWLFPSPITGGPRSASMLLQKGLKPIAQSLGLGDVTWHTLRHACRSWLGSAGASVGAQKDLLRQADITTTMNIHGRALTAEMREAHERLVSNLLTPKQGHV